MVVVAGQGELTHAEGAAQAVDVLTVAIEGITLSVDTQATAEHVVKGVGSGSAVAGLVAQVVRDFEGLRLGPAGGQTQAGHFVGRTTLGAHLAAVQAEVVVGAVVLALDKGLEALQVRVI